MTASTDRAVKWPRGGERTRIVRMIPHPPIPDRFPIGSIITSSPKVLAGKTTVIGRGPDHRRLRIGPVNRFLVPHSMDRVPRCHRFRVQGMERGIYASPHVVSMSDDPMEIP
jgi:hypothetical protein